MEVNVIAIWGAPRTGTSWLGQIFDSAPNVRYQMAPFYSWNYRDKLTVRATEEEIHNYFMSVYNSTDTYLLQSDRREKGIYPTWKEKRSNPDFLVFKEVTCIYMLPVLMRNYPNIKSVIIVRNPYDQLKSWINNKKEFHDDWVIDEEWYFGQKRNELGPESYFGFHKWKEAVMTFCEIEKEFPDRVFIIQYEDLYKNPEEATLKMFRFCGIEYEAQTEEFLFQSSTTFVDDPFSVYRRHSEDNPLNTKQIPDNIREIIKHELEYFEPAKRFHW